MESRAYTDGVSVKIMDEDLLVLAVISCVARRAPYHVSSGPLFEELGNPCRSPLSCFLSQLLSYPSW